MFLIFPKPACELLLDHLGGPNHLVEILSKSFALGLLGQVRAEVGTNSGGQCREEHGRWVHSDPPEGSEGRVHHTGKAQSEAVHDPPATRRRPPRARQRAAHHREHGPLHGCPKDGEDLRVVRGAVGGAPIWVPRGPRAPRGGRGRAARGRSAHAGHRATDLPARARERIEQRS